MIMIIFHNRKYLLAHMKNCFIAMIKGNEVPTESQKVKVFSHQVQYSEATTESVIQLTFSCIILRQFGLPNDPFQRYVQLSSLFGSILSITFQFAKVSSFIVFWHNMLYLLILSSIMLFTSFCRDSLT